MFILRSLNVPLQHFTDFTVHKYKLAIFGTLESVPSTFEVERFHFNVTY